jgi:hypothetical protein
MIDALLMRAFADDPALLAGRKSMKTRPQGSGALGPAANASSQSADPIRCSGGLLGTDRSENILSQRSASLRLARVLESRPSYPTVATRLSRLTSDAARQRQPNSELSMRRLAFALVVGVVLAAPSQGQSTTKKHRSRKAPIQHEQRKETRPVPTGASAQCRDDSYSFSAHRRGTCSHHGGVARWLGLATP